MRLLVLLGFSLHAAFGQVVTDTAIRGLVTDSSGASVAGAAVSILEVDTGVRRHTATDVSGAYSFQSLVPGKYDVAATHSGFKRAEVKGRVAQVSQVAQMDFVLQVGETAESITVSAEGAELITTSNAEIAGTINSRLTQELPLNGRNYLDAAVNLPHVSLQNLGPQVSFAGSSSNAVLGSNAANPMFRPSGLFAAGNRDSGTNVSIDGINVQSSVYRQATPQQPPSAIQEVKIRVSGMSAEFGNGVAAVNVITKSGSNQLHGEVYEFLRNSYTDATNFFNNLSGRSNNPLKLNQFGGAAGGPIVRNKLFIFGAYEGLRVRQSVFTSVTRPPAAARAGDFSNFRLSATSAVPVIYNPFQYDAKTGLRTPFPGNRIPQGLPSLCAPRPTCIDTAAQKFVELYLPSSNTTIDGIPYYAGYNIQALDSNQGLTRVDYAAGDRDRIYGRYGRTLAPSANRTLESLAANRQNIGDQNGGAHWTRVLSASSINDFTLGYARPKWNLGKDPEADDAGKAIGFVNTSSVGGGPGFSNTGYSMNSSPSNLLDGTDNLFQAADDFSYARGRHSFKAGAQFIHRRFYYTNQSNDKGSFSFSSVYTAACPDGNAACTAARTAAGLPAGGNAFASFLVGAPLTILFQLNNAGYNGQQNYRGFYAQDSWRVSRRLTLNYGLRYEHWTPWHVPRHTVATFDEKTASIVYVLQQPLDYLKASTNYGRNAPLNPNAAPDAYRTSTRDFSPRAGLAWSFNPATVLRVGFGLYYDGNSNTNQLSDISSGVGPFKLRYDATASSNEQVPNLSLAGNLPFPNATAIPAPNSNPLSTFRFVPSYYPVSSVYQWSASLQRRISSVWQAEISYQGTHAIHLPQFVDVNAPALPQGSLATVAINARRHLPQWGVLGTWRPIGYGRYNGVAGQLRNLQWHGFTLISSMTFAKNIVSSILGASDQGNQHGDYPYLWRGPARLTPRIRFVNSFSYDLPFASKSWFGGRNRVAAAVVGGWRISGIQDFTTGTPDYVTTTDNSGTGYGTMPDRICDGTVVPGGRDRLHWFNTACFVNAPFGRFGNSNFGVFEDPGINNLNIALARIIKLRFLSEQSALRIRADAFNFLNHTQFTGPTATTLSTNSAAGRVGSARPARYFQFSATYMF